MNLARSTRAPLLLTLAGIGLLAGCSSPLSCDILDDQQASMASQTCNLVASLGGGATVDVPLDGGGTFTIDGLPTVWSRSTFDDGLVVYVDEDAAQLSDGTADRETVPVGAEGYAVAAPVGDRYALALEDGRLSIRSRTASSVIEIPIEIEFTRIDQLAFAEFVPMAFSADASRLAFVEASRRAVVVDAGTGDVLWETVLDADADTVSLSSDGRLVAITIDDDVVCTFDTTGDGEPICRDHPRGVADAIFTPEDSQLVVWLAETTSTRRIYSPNSSGAPGGDPTRTREVTTTTPASVVVWALP